MRQGPPHQTLLGSTQPSPAPPGPFPLPSAARSKTLRWFCTRSSSPKAYRTKIFPSLLLLSLRELLSQFCSSEKEKKKALMQSYRCHGKEHCCCISLCDLL